MNLTHHIKTDQTTIHKKETRSGSIAWLVRKIYHPLHAHLMSCFRSFLQSHKTHKQLSITMAVVSTAIIITTSFFLHHKNDKILYSTVSYGKALIHTVNSDNISNWLAKGMTDIPGWKRESTDKLISAFDHLKDADALKHASIIDVESQEIKAHTDRSLIYTKYTKKTSLKTIEKGDIRVSIYKDQQGDSLIHIVKTIFYGKGIYQKVIGELHLDILAEREVQAINRNKTLFRLASSLLLILTLFASSLHNKYKQKNRSPFTGESLGPYILEEKINQGGMAELYIAKKKRGKFEMRVAIKKILPQWSNDKVFIHSLINEATMLSQLRHPNIVSIHDCTNFEETYFIDMDYIDGKDLDILMKTSKEKISVGMTLYIMKSIYKGLFYAHYKKDDFTGKSLDIVHRDISPHNILVSNDGEIKIVDFGIAKAKYSNGDPAMSQRIKGKVRYMSPEQASGKPMDSRSDIYSAGILFYELLTGQQMNTGKDMKESLLQAKEPTIPSLEQIKKDIPATVSRILLTTLEREPNERYQKASFVSEEIERFTHSAPEYFFNQSMMAAFMKNNPTLTTKNPVRIN